MSQISDGTMTLMEHIIELRNRLMIASGAVIVGFIFCYVFSDQTYDFLVEPLSRVLQEQNAERVARGLEPIPRRMIFTDPTEVFFTYIKLAFFSGLFLAFPVVAYQFWGFVAPGLYRKEKKTLLPYLILSPVLFFLGGALVYYFIFPLAWKFFVSFEDMGVASSDTLPIQMEAKVNEYLTLVIRLIFAFGLSFQLPLLLTLLARVGIVTSRGLAAKRKYALIIVFIVAAILTPPDIISQVGLAIPILILYELSIFAVRGVEKARRQREEEEDDELELEETDFNEA